jgi:hypothetical protein
MRLKPKSEQEVAAAGNDMIKLKVAIYNADGRRRTVFDYLMDTESMGYKLRHCAAATGNLTDYERGELHADDLVGKTGTCKLGIRKATEEYPAQNQINDYIVPQDSATSAAQPRREPAVAGAGAGGDPSWISPRPGRDDLNDDIPF